MLDPQSIESLRQIMKDRMASDVGMLDDLRAELVEFKRGIKPIRP